MARYVRFEAQRPIKLEPQEKAVFICACGLSKTFPICDGRHKRTLNEKPDGTFVYDAECESACEVTAPTPVS